MSVDVMEEEWLYSEEQVRALLEWVRGREDVERSVYPLMCIVAEQALRPGEARALRVGDVDLPVRGWGKLAVGSGRTERNVPLKPRLVEFLREWISEAGLREEDLLFPGRDGYPLSASQCQRVWEQAQEAVLARDELYSWRLGEPISILRETCLVRWLQAGVSRFAVAELAGVTPNWLAMRYPYCFRVENDMIDRGQLSENMAVPESLKS
ncbi:tyrosine-type recombinase/integrase [Streptomyces diacarni]|uniref:tyrosine-type recombinase/integrase n=1 Tax=Streptomyces diacarni TaxID=2800381 RepID=UPI003409ED38